MVGSGMYAWIRQVPVLRVLQPALSLIPQLVPAPLLLLLLL